MPSKNLLCTDGIAVKARTLEGEISPLRCKRWSCPTCAEWNRRRIIAIATRAKPRAMLTLTVSSDHYDTPDEAADALKRGLRLLRLRLSRHEKLENFSFLAVFERHKSGFPHLHLLIRGKYIPWQQLRTWWEEITGSTHVDIRAIETRGKAAFYVAKYLGKDLAPFAKCKRWWRSHDYSDPSNDDYVPDYSQPRPTLWTANLHRLRFTMLAEGWAVEKAGPDTIRYRAPPDSPYGIADLIALSSGATHPSICRRERRGGQ